MSGHQWSSIRAIDSISCVCVCSKFEHDDETLEDMKSKKKNNKRPFILLSTKNYDMNGNGNDDVGHHFKST